MVGSLLFALEQLMLDGVHAKFIWIFRVFLLKVAIFCSDYSISRIFPAINPYLIIRSISIPYVHLTSVASLNCVPFHQLAIFSIQIRIHPIIYTQEKIIKFSTLFRVTCWC